MVKFHLLLFSVRRITYLCNPSNRNKMKKELYSNVPALRAFILAFFIKKN
jgi:hypothetical protein